ncbi:MAG: hypothetical protein KME16_12535 [Scytolyngbya sp. HA4215-MV1]|jgi:hypothetical protein|nr:hypothetical protein [Scytolyngbya sp. HA4215-MV1]
MVTALVLIGLGVLVQTVVLTTTQTVLPRFVKVCPTCRNQLPPMEYPPAIYDCPECERLISVGVDLSDPLPRL